MGVFKIVVCIWFWFMIASAIADPSMCYYCNSDADGVGCHTPINQESVRVQYCGNSSISDYQSKANTPKASNGTYVCATLTYTSVANSFVTIRECQSRVIEQVDICTFLSQSAAILSYSRNFDCNTCETDLCNSTATVYLSAILYMTVVFKTIIFFS